MGRMTHWGWQGCTGANDKEQEDTGVTKMRRTMYQGSGPQGGRDTTNNSKYNDMPGLVLRRLRTMLPGWQQSQSTRASANNEDQEDIPAMKTRTTMYQG